MARLKERYKKIAVPALIKEFGYKNHLSVPRVTKAVINVGISAKNNDPKFFETAESSLRRITGQKPVRTLAKKSISNFKIRKNMTVGMMVTLRGERLYSFLEKLINVTLARVRDFRGLSPKSVDSRGNLTIGFREHVAFPEIRSDEVERVHGLEVTVVTNACSREESLALLKQLGFPFIKN
ncbi:50S ribosomal protein L5 [Patescibacteria group bacterium]|nr:MAG: 50S ribosomal protein L5 [Patescibacteria group bacterium]